MSDTEGYAISVGPSRTTLRLLGIWPDPDEKKNVFSRIYFLFPSICILYFCIIPQTKMVVKVWGNLNAVLDVLTTADIPVTIALFKILGVWYNGDVLAPLVQSMAKDWRSSRNALELQTMWKYAKLGRIFSVVLLFLVGGTVVAYIFGIFLLSFNDSEQKVLEGYNTSEKFRQLYYKSEFFYDVQPSPLFEITWLSQCISSTFAASAFASIDAFFSVLVLHLCSQLKILKRKLKSLPETIAKQNDSFIEVLLKIVGRHEFLYRYSNVLEKTFNLMFLAQMMTSSMAFCLLSYQLIMITTDRDSIVIFDLICMLCFTLAFLFSLFVYCYVADILRTESMEIGNAAYRSNWYNLRPAETRLLILVMVRARRPFEITAGKFAAFSLELYCGILKSSGGYISMLLAMKSRLAANV